VIDKPHENDRLTTMGYLIEAYTGLVAKIAPQLDEHGLSFAEFDVLLRLGRTPGGRLRMSDLAAQVELSTSGVTRLVDRLEAGRLVERAACPTDRRGAYAVITEEGVERLEKALPGHVEVIETWFLGLLTPTEVNGITRSLRKVRDAVRPEATAGAEGPPPGERLVRHTTR
jgi:DNA-binding MarR family transcriptional regulator